MQVHCHGWLGKLPRTTNADGSSTAATIALPEGAINFNMGTLVGSYASVARMLDEIDTVNGVKGVNFVQHASN